ncbi:hypothetical protein ACIHCV_38085 [Streptomyces sp. NPDC051956]|uniref:hypothetical protein n=1 Tax=Streptomyces sp. NPDC051956 TaxID=3365677 RepID=UPI0037D8BBBE
MISALGLLAAPAAEGPLHQKQQESADAPPRSTGRYENQASSGHGRTVAFSGGTVCFGGATFSADNVYFADATFSGGTVNFSGATFSGTRFNWGPLPVPAGA